MKRHPQSDRTQPAFTLVEIVTAIAIIAILAAILVPAFSLAMKTAMNVKQKGQFNSINIALEAFRTDFGDYPESYNPNDATNQYGGAQRLAEAVIGFDGFGFHPRSVFSRYATDSTVPGGKELYLLPNSKLTDAEKDTSLKSRKGPYLELETANAVKIADLYGSVYSGDLLDSSFILSDAFGTVKNKRTNKQTGMPILYYKANPTASQHNPANYSAAAYDTTLNIFDLRHNQWIINLGRPLESTASQIHPIVAKPTLFYEATRNPNYYNPNDQTDKTLWRPYRAESFILQSAGPDGLYGTPDDVFNFEPGK
jgi:prepilin-type N-terminal cleavage/methylation domain-containing protein